MKKIKYIKEIIILLLITFSMSCKDEFLEEKPLAFLSPENTFTDAAGLQTVLNMGLKGVFNQWNGDTRELMFNHNMSDATVVSCTDKQDAFVDLRRYATPLNSRDNDAARHLTFYREGYKMIKSMNTVIDYIDIPDWEGGVDDPERNHLLGSAYFLRAFYYMQLTMQFGNVAFPLNVVTEARQDFMVFHMQGIWDQMILDLEWAVQHVKQASALPKGQAPNAAVRMLLAKYYMLNERFADAEEQMDIAINSGEHKLFTDADVNVATVSVGNTINPNTGEVNPGRTCDVPADAINLLHQNKDAGRVSNPEGIWLNVNAPFIEGKQDRGQRVRAWGPNFVSTNKGVKAPPTGTVTGASIAQDGKSRMMTKWGRGQGFARPTNYSQFYIWQFKGENDTIDYRHKPGNWFEMSDVLYDNPDLAETEWYLQPAQLYYNDVLLCEDSVRCWYGYPIYKFWAPNIEDRLDRQDGGRADMYVYRLAEAYLIRAEAKFWQEDYQGAADDINIIRQRANAIHMYTAADVQTDGIGAVLDERCRELYGEEYRHDELVRISVILAKTGKPCYNGKTYSISGNDLEISLSEASFYYDRMMEKNDFYRENTHWATYTDISYTMDPMHIFWPVYQNYIVGNVGNVLNQTTGYDGSERNVEPLTHVVQTPGLPNVDPMDAIGAR